MNRLTDPQSLRYVSQAVLCELLSISPTTCNKLERDGILMKHGRGCYDAIASLLPFIQHQIDNAAGQSERSKLINQQARKLELQNELAEGNLISTDDASRVMIDFATALRSGLTALPARIAHQLAGINSPASIRKLLSTEINLFLEAAHKCFSESFRLEDRSASTDT